MKAKFVLLTLFLVLLGVGSFASEARKKTHASCKAYERIGTRTPFEPSVLAKDINDCLYLTFRFSLHDTDITITDKNGNEVVNEQQTFIYEGRVIVIPQSNDYPYSIEITSPTVEIQGEIVLE